MPPGLVSEMVTPEKSLPVSLPLRARTTMSSYASTNCLNDRVSHSRMAATTSAREPSLFCMSMARPRLMFSGTTRVGLPSTTS